MSTTVKYSVCCSFLIDEDIKLQNDVEREYSDDENRQNVW